MNTKHVTQKEYQAIMQINELAEQGVKHWEKANDGTRNSKSRKTQQTKYDKTIVNSCSLAKSIKWTLDYPGLYPTYTDPNGHNHINHQSAIKFGGVEGVIKSISVEGFLWFDTRAGNTYHNFKLTIDGEAFYGETQYGYGEQYVYSAFEFLRNVLGVPCDGAPWRWCQAQGINFEYGKIDVNKEKFLNEMAV